MDTADSFQHDNTTMSRLHGARTHAMGTTHSVTHILHTYGMHTLVALQHSIRSSEVFQMFITRASFLHLGGLVAEMA